MNISDVRFDADGFIVDSDDWTSQLAEKIAAREGVGPLSDAHWKVIEALRAHYLRHRTLPVMRLICHETGLELHCVSDLLADPRRAWRIAGLPNPGEEAMAYMQTAELSD
jgi:tRNA 2-thiouridine synthesizing protein E